MNGLSLRDPQVLGALVAAGLCVGGVIAWSKLRKKTTEEELERQRRQYLFKSGRIMDGTILDISDVDADQSGRTGGMQLILYKYEIAGVVYECSQDVTHLKDHVNIYELPAGVSVFGSLRSASSNKQHYRGGELEWAARYGQFGSGTPRSRSPRTPAPSIQTQDVTKSEA